MLVISDTNIPSSLAACEALSYLFHLLPDTIIYIPPTVHQELKIGLEKGKIYLDGILKLIGTDQIKVLELLEVEQDMMKNLPHKLNRGEREAIVLAKNRQALLLCNDKLAIRYCQQQGIDNINLPYLLRLFWKRKIISKAQVEQLIERMAQVENLVLKPNVRTTIFSE